jgi:hypothetical protein
MGPPVRASSGGPTEILPVSYGLPDENPMASPCSMVCEVCHNRWRQSSCRNG